MSNTFGATTLPITAPTTGAAVSDPALDVLLSFCKAVLNADATTAWTARAAGETPAVTEVFAHDPLVGNFIDRDLPALFAYRDNGGTYEDEGIDLQRENTTIRMRWVFPPAVQGPQIARDPIVSGLSKSLAAAIRLGRHSSWVVADDLADDVALRLATATSLTAQTVTGAGFTGALAGVGIHAARPISITTTAATGAYNTTDPIALSFLLDDDREHSESVYLTNANGGETINGIWPAAIETSVELPAMLTTGGTIAIGYADSPEVTRGSLVKRAAGLSMLSLVGPAKRNTLSIAIEGADPQPQPYRTLDFELRIQEIYDVDMDVSFDATADADDEGESLGPLPMSIEIIHPEPDGEVIEQAYFPDA